MRESDNGLWLNLLIFHANRHREVAVLLKSHTGRDHGPGCQPMSVGNAAEYGKSMTKSLAEYVRQERHGFALGEDGVVAILVVALDQQQALHAGVSLTPDDDVVVHADAQPFARFDDLFRHLDIGARWRRVA